MYDEKVTDRREPCCCQRLTKNIRSVRLCTISLDEEDFFTEIEGDEEEVLNVVEPSR